MKNFLDKIVGWTSMLTDEQKHELDCLIILTAIFTVLVHSCGVVIASLLILLYLHWGDKKTSQKEGDVSL